jgi:DNA polymerase III gamma/tau subunit
VLQIRDDLLDMCAELADAEWVESLRAGEMLVDAAERWWLAGNEAEMAEKALKASRDRVLRTSMSDILDVLATWFRDLLLLSADPTAEAIVNMDRADQLRQLAPRYQPQKCQAACEHLQTMHAQLRQNANLRLAAENLALRLIVT